MLPNLRTDIAGSEGLVEVEIREDDHGIARLAGSELLRLKGCTRSIPTLKGKRRGIADVLGLQELSISGMSISDDQIRHCNDLILEKMSTIAAVKTWELGKKSGSITLVRKMT